MNKEATEDEPFAFTVPAQAFRDVDAGDVLTYSASADSGSPLPAWLTFDPATRSFSGTPANEDVGSIALRLSATDLSGAQASQAFTLTVNNVNDAPEVGVALGDQSARQGETLTWRIPAAAFVDADAGDILSYSARLSDDRALPGWLSFDAASGAFSGTPADIGRYDIRVTATDLAGAAVSQTFALDVTAGGNQPPLVEPDAASVSEDRKLVAWGNLLANDRDPEGNPLTVADAGIRRGEYGWLALLPNGAYAYRLDDGSPSVQGLAAGETAQERFGYLASDGQRQGAGELAVTVQGTNDTPVLFRALADVQLAKGKTFSWQIPAGSFTDRDRNDTLSYTATLANGRPLPDWLKFDAATQAFSGTAPANAQGNLDVRVVASDGQGERSSASDVFRIRVGNRTVLPKGKTMRGDGEDPPPGHDYNWNDGAGSGPGHPGSLSGGRTGQSPACRDIDEWLKDWGKGGGIAHGRFACLDPHRIGGYRDLAAEAGRQERKSGDSYLRRWAEMEARLARHLADDGNDDGWGQTCRGADLRGLHMLSGGDWNLLRGGADPLLLYGAPDAGLRVFRGLQEGIERIG